MKESRGIRAPCFALLGAGAVTVRFISGLGEFTGYTLRLASGYLANRTERYLLIISLGCGFLVSVPLLTLVKRWEIAAMLLISERMRKAIRTPSRDVILSHATKHVGRGWWFTIHYALDQLVCDRLSRSKKTSKSWECAVTALVSDDKTFYITISFYYQYVLAKRMNAIETKPRIENIVASTQFAKELDLNTIAERLEGSEYDPERFPGLIYRLSDPKTAILLFRSGKANCTGGKSLEEVRRAVRKIAELLNKSGIPVNSDPEIEVQNMVAIYDIGCALNLTNLTISLGIEDVEYEPEQFPGLVYRVRDPNVVCLIFGSGKMVITGAKNEKEIQRAVDKIIQTIHQSGLL